ncbi:MAG: hypothetical protein ACREM3_25410, partial [Candidatus Rokuibacteriota bacterium]
RGEVSGKGPDGVVELSVRGVNQRGEVTASGTATVVLPVRGAGPRDLAPGGRTDVSSIPQAAGP